MPRRLLDGLPLATDDRFLGRVSDQHVNAALAGNRRSHGFGRARHDPGDPVDRLAGRDSPEPASGITGTGQLGLETDGDDRSRRSISSRSVHALKATRAADSPRL